MNYQRIYDSIINKAKSQNRVKSKDTYYEAHHIVPVCLGGEGRTSHWKTHPNIVLLTGKEHFMCHKLLAEIHPKDYKLARAFFMMCFVKDNNQKRYVPHGRAIEQAKVKFIEAQRNMNDETKKKMSESSKGNTKWLGKHHTEETKKKIGDLRRGKPGTKHTEEFKKRLSELRKGDNNPMAILAKKGLTEEHRRNLSVAQLGSKHPHSKVTCPHCNVTGGKANMVRYHFDNCKKKKASS